MGPIPRNPGVLAAPVAAALIGIVNIRPQPQMAKVTSRTLIDGEMVARIEVPADATSVMIAEIVLPDEYHTATTVPVRVLSDRSVEVGDQSFRLPGTGLLVIVALMGALLGLAVVNNMSGFGFVKGTGAPGTMQPSDVDEDRGFYWRS
jgi:hypothetical protein